MNARPDDKDDSIQTEVTPATATLQASELARHPGHAAQAGARWSGLRAAAERLHATLRPRFVSTVLLLGGAMAVSAGVLSCVAR